MDLGNLEPAANVAIELLRPGATEAGYTMYDNEFTEWNHDSVPPSWETIIEVQELIKRYK